MIRFLKDWTLAIAICLGIVAYCVYTSIPALNSTHRAVGTVVSVVQPLLVAVMLFISFCKVDPKELKFKRWQPFALILQVGMFLLGAAILLLVDCGKNSLFVECGMLCFICPTATAAVVVTARLGGQVGSLTLYTIITNIVTAILIPLVVPLIHPTATLAADVVAPSAEMQTAINNVQVHINNVGAGSGTMLAGIGNMASADVFVNDFLMIMARVFPMLIVPLILAMLLRAISLKVTHAIGRKADIAFYLWAVTLFLSTGLAVRSLVRAQLSLLTLSLIALVALGACATQFYVGRRMGRRDNETITAQQSCGQKNNAFAIWLGYTFLTPATSLAAGFYLIYQNIFNSWQLYRHSHQSDNASHPNASADLA